MADPDVRVDRDGPVATVTLCRPRVLNAQTPQMWAQLRAKGREMGGDIRVVVVRGEIDQKKGDDTEPVDGPVVVGIDGTPRSEAALKFAFEEASARQAPLVAVHTWSDALNDPYLAPMIDWDVVETEEELQLAERLAGWGEKYPDVPVERLVTRGRAASVLLDRSKGAQLVVVGSRGHGEFAGLLLDSVSNALIHGASCPVAIVRNTEES